MARKKSKPPARPARASRVREDPPAPAAGRAQAAEPAVASPAAAPAARRPSALLDTRVIYCGDNLDQLKKLPEACVDLVYIDPPFNSNRNYEVFWGETQEKRAFEDRHASTQAYIEFMRPRCVELHRVLKQTGSFYYHCDWHASHYVKVMLDQVFGHQFFHNEIIWRRTTAKSQSYRQFPNNHDSIFFYVNGRNVFNRQFKPLSDERIAQHYGNEDATGRRLSYSDLTGDGLRAGPCGRPWRGFDPAKIGKGRHWRTTPDELDHLDHEGRIYFPPAGGFPRLKNYLDTQKGVQIDTVWEDIAPINSQAKEALGYPTQKPLALLERIIKASSNEGDVILDAFCGCGTALVAAENLKRQWIGVDVSPTACRVMAKRLRDVCGMKEDEQLWKIGRGFVVRDLPWTADKLRAIPPFEFENWAVIALGGIPNKTKVGDMGIDGRIYPLSAIPKRAGKDELGFMDDWYPIQVKQKERAGRPDIDSFEAVLHREDRKKGFFVAFDYSEDALREVDAFFRKSHKAIIALTVKEILEERLAKKLA